MIPTTLREKKSVKHLKRWRNDLIGHFNAKSNLNGYIYPVDTFLMNISLMQEFDK